MLNTERRAPSPPASIAARMGAEEEKRAGAARDGLPQLAP